MNSWRDAEELTVPGSGSVTYRLPDDRPMVLEKLTIWLLSKGVLPGNLTAQLKVNGKNFGSSVVVAGAAKAADVVFGQGGDGDELLFPLSPKSDTAAKFVVELELSNAGGTAVAVTVYAAAKGGS